MKILQKYSLHLNCNHNYLLSHLNFLNLYLHLSFHYLLMHIHYSLYFEYFCVFIITVLKLIMTTIMITAIQITIYFLLFSFNLFIPFTYENYLFLCLHSCLTTIRIVEVSYSITITIWF